MPKKTKKQKLLAELHRKIEVATKASAAELVKSQNVSASIDPVTPHIPTFTYNKNSIVRPKTQSVKADYSYVQHDLIRITIFTLFATIFQGVLYFLLQRR